MFGYFLKGFNDKFVIIVILKKKKMTKAHGLCATGNLRKYNDVGLGYIHSIRCDNYCDIFNTMKEKEPEHSRDSYSCR